jgi:excisionase family DNA binding protein
MRELELPFELAGTSEADPLCAAFMSIAEFAMVLGVSQSTVERRVKDRTIRAIRVGKLWRIPTSEIARLLG